MENKTYFIFYGPSDTWLALPSGPSAHVFAQNGQFIDWSRDTGDDKTFNDKWPKHLYIEISIKELERLTAPE